MVPFADVIRLNRYAQGSLPAADGKLWFSEKAKDEKRAVLQELALMIQQAHPTPEEIVVGISRAGLSPTHTPAVILSKGPTKIQLMKAISLPEAEYEKVFLLFLGVLGVADARRRALECSQGCTHWWHRNLSKDEVVRSLMEQFSK